MARHSVNSKAVVRGNRLPGTGQERADVAEHPRA